MKRVNDLYNKINNIDVIMNMYDDVVSKTTKNKRKIMKFDDYYSCNIENIKKIINNNNYYPNRYNIFFIREPKLRIIMSQSIKDKVINHLVAKYFLSDVFDKTLIDKNCATRIGKGTHYALKLFKKHYHDCSLQYDKFYILKFDISKYFYNIDHDIVKEIISNKIKDKKVIKMVNTIIDSTDYSYVNEVITRLKENEINRISTLNISKKEKDIKIDEVNKLPLYKKGKGLCIGNMSSQVIATFYLNELDHYIKSLGVKYVRYMDDGVLMHSDKEYLKKCLVKIEEILQKYKLVLNKKTKIYYSNEEVEFLGFRFSISNDLNIIMRLTNKTKKSFKRKMKKMYSNYDLNKCSYDDMRSVRDSYMGHLRYGDYNNLIRSNIRFGLPDCYINLIFCLFSLRKIIIK